MCMLATPVWSQQLNSTLLFGQDKTLGEAQQGSVENDLTE